MCISAQKRANSLQVFKDNSSSLQVWFQNRRAKHRKHEKQMQKALAPGTAASMFPIGSAAASAAAAAAAASAASTPAAAVAAASQIMRPMYPPAVSRAYPAPYGGLPLGADGSGSGAAGGYGCLYGQATSNASNVSGAAPTPSTGASSSADGTTATNTAAVTTAAEDW